MSRDGREETSAGKADSVVNISQDLQSLISKNSELGSRLLSLLLVSSGNGKEIIDAINQGDLSRIQKLNLDLNLKASTADERSQENKNANESTQEAVIKKRRSTEASARFRVRKKQREQEKLSELKTLNSKINDLHKRIDVLFEENRYWKFQLEKLNDKKSKELLESIKRRNAASP